MVRQAICPLAQARARGVPQGRACQCKSSELFKVVRNICAFLEETVQIVWTKLMAIHISFSFWSGALWSKWMPLLARHVKIECVSNEYGIESTVDMTD